MIKVFLSYAHEDLSSARKLYTQLNSIEALNIWFDKITLKPGQNWDVEIRKAIKSAHYCLVLLSRHSMKRGFYQKEIRIALDVLKELPEGQIFLIPVRLDNVTPHFEELSAIHYVDMFPDWFEGFRQISRAMDVLETSSNQLIDFDLELSCILQWDGKKTTELVSTDNRRFNPTPATYGSSSVWNDNLNNRIQIWRSGRIEDYDINFGVGTVGRPSIWENNIAWEQRIKGVPQRQIVMLLDSDSDPVVLSKEGDNITPSIFESAVAWCRSGHGGVYVHRNEEVVKIDDVGTACSLYDANIAWQSKEGIHFFDGSKRRNIAPAGSHFPSVYNDNVAYQYKGNIFVWENGRTIQITSNGNNYISYPWQRSLWENSIVWRHLEESSPHIFVARQSSNEVEVIKVSRCGINTDPSIANGNVVWLFKYNYETFLRDQFLEFASTRKVKLSSLDHSQRVLLENEFAKLDQEMREKFIQIIINRPWAD